MGTAAKEKAPADFVCKCLKFFGTEGEIRYQAQPNMLICQNSPGWVFERSDTLTYQIDPVGASGRSGKEGEPPQDSDGSGQVFPYDNDVAAEMAMPVEMETYFGDWHEIFMVISVEGQTMWNTLDMNAGR